MSSIPPPDPILSHGLMPGVVGPYAYDDLEHVRRAEQLLPGFIRGHLRKLELPHGASGAELERAREVPLRVWTERSLQLAPDSSSLGMGWRLCFSVPDDCHQAVRDMIDANIPNSFEQLELWLMPWPNDGA